ncbi:MAG: NAD(P)-dependent glycerol-3-phosphate dehydrogenase [Defluviitaleaceae bacterium]|nr:NAD(P)-dependent glycerol-3-phosphate dehydrogenase [Defluviitaleaceae bacterium]
MKRICVIGFGTWGIALASHLDKKGYEVTAWDNEEYIGKISRTRKNEYLKDVVISDSIGLTADIGCATGAADIFVCTLTSKVIGEVLPKFAPFISDGQIIVSTSKGLENKSLMRLSQYIKGVARNAQVAVLTGPSHAEEVLKSIPTAVVAASEDEKIAEIVQDVFLSENFRVYTSTDIIGAEIGGALKNVVALAAGCSDGLGFGDNTKAALITRGIAEITRLGVAMGAKEQTFAGLSGIGDLIVTCTSSHSRNWCAGSLLAKGKKLDDVIAEIGLVAEGVNTAKSALKLAEKFNVTMPIVEEINKILFEGKNPKTAVTDLMLRRRREEGL